MMPVVGDRQFGQDALHPCSLRCVEAMEGLRQIIVADAKAGKGALEPFDDCRAVLSDGIEQFALAKNVGLEFGSACCVVGGEGLVEADEHVRPEIGATADAAVTAGIDGFREKLFRAQQYREIGPLLGDRQSAPEIGQIAGTVLESHDLRNLDCLGQHFESEGGLREARHIVEEDG